MASIVPEIRFDWLGELPGVAEEGRIRRARSSLGDLKLNTSKDLENAAGRLAGLGDFEGALKLSTLASQRKSAEASMLGASQRGMMDVYSLGLMQKLMGGGGLSLPSRGGAAEPTVPSGPAASPPQPDPFSRPQGAIPGVSALPPSLSPSEQVLAQVEAGPQSTAPMQRLAGPPQAPAAPAELPAWMQSAVPPGPVPAQTPAAAPLPPSTAQSPRQQAMDEIDALTRQAVAIPRGLPGMQATFQARLRDAINRANPSQAQRDFIEENARRAQAQEPLLRNEAEYELYKKAQFPTFEAAMKHQGEYRADERQAIKDNSAITMFKAIVNHPAFEAGEGTAEFNQMKAIVRNWKDVLVSGGYLQSNDPLARTIDTATASVPLREAANALSSQLVISSLGGLGSGRSDSDRMVTALSIPGILQSKDGSRILAEYMSAKADNAKAIGQKIRDYAREKGHNAKPYEQDQIARDYADSHPILVDKNGKPTELGKRLDALQGPSQSGVRITPADEGRSMTDDEGNQYVVRNGVPVLVKRK